MHQLKNNNTMSQLTIKLILYGRAPSLIGRGRALLGPALDTPLVAAGKLPIKTLVARQWATNDTIIAWVEASVPQLFSNPNPTPSRDNFNPKP